MCGPYLEESGHERGQADHYEDEKPCDTLLSTTQVSHTMLATTASHKDQYWWGHDEYTPLSIHLYIEPSTQQQKYDIKLQPFNCFVLFWWNMKETALYLTTC